MEDNKLGSTYESNNPITRNYFRWKVLLAIKLADLKKSDVILDFGCGGGWLEKKLKDYEIYGYDINPKKTFVKDYKNVKPSKIFVLDVFEHIPLEEIKKVLKSFKELNENFELIVSLPSENFVSRKIRKLVGKSEVPKEHITKYRDIMKILKQNFKLKKRINFFSVSYIWVFEFKNRNNLPGK